ncbi:hypothetical protein KLP28_00225 [Nocardioidaceae bacterium]|nr:hypothetical protein KLP28_00225 [Nocardioidaceae bacterium]
MSSDAWLVTALVALAVLVVLLVLVGVLLVSVRSTRRRAAADRAAADQAREDVAVLTARLDRLAGEVEDTRRQREAAAETGYLITDAGIRKVEPEVSHAPTRIVVSGPLGEGVVRGMAVAHGLRTALRPANRNRIGFAMKQEVRRARKQRREELRTARRLVRDQQRAGLTDSD